MRWLASTFFLLVSVGCTETLVDSCTEYVDYMCSCHEDDPDFDCSELQNIYENAGQDQQDECAISLDDQLALDDTGIECESGDTGI
jgi:hypothetical protein